MVDSRSQSKMTRFPYDRFAKDYLQELLSLLGSVETSKDVAGEVREIDVYFAPSPQPQMAQESGSIAPFMEN